MGAHPGVKADLFAETFAKKCVLAEREDNRYTNLERCNESQWQLLVRTTENAKRQLTCLRVDSATGPDVAPARILQECANQLALPLALLALRIIGTMTWPASWMVHWIVPIYKKGMSYIPGNYRGSHLTS